MTESGHTIRRLVTRLLVIVAVLALAVPAGAEDGVTASEIVIGGHGPLTGPISIVGLSNRDGLAMAFAEVNDAGGVHGRKLRLEFLDDQAEPTQGVAVVKRLIEQYKAFMVVGGSGSTPTVAIVPLMKEAKVPYYNTTAASPKILGEFSRYVFSGATSRTFNLARVNAEYIARKLGSKKVALLHGLDEWPRTMCDAVDADLKARKVEVIERKTFTTGDTDFTSQIMTLRRAEPETVMLCGHPKDASIIVRQARQLGLKANLVGDGTMSNDSIIAVAGPAAEGFAAGWLGSQQYITSSHPDMVEFQTRFQKRYSSMPKGRPSTFDLYGYADGYVIAEALKRAGKDVTREKFIDGLESLKGWVAGAKTGWSRAVSLGLPRTFSKTDHEGNKGSRIVVVKGGKFETIDWAPPAE